MQAPTQVIWLKFLKNRRVCHSNRRASRLSREAHSTRLRLSVNPLFRGALRLSPWGPAKEAYLSHYFYALQTILCHLSVRLTGGGSSASVCRMIVTAAVRE